MRYFVIVVLTFILSVSARANAGTNAGILGLVHKDGFNGCDSAIEKQFAYYIKSPGGRLSKDYFEANGKTLSIMATWGEPGDSIFQKVVFEKTNTECRAYITSFLTSKMSCMEYKEKNPDWKYIDTQGSYTWLQNKGGVDALFNTLPSGDCGILYSYSTSYPIDAQQTSKKQQKSAN